MQCLLHSEITSHFSLALKSWEMEMDMEYLKLVTFEQVTGEVWLHQCREA